MKTTPKNSSPAQRIAADTADRAINKHGLTGQQAFNYIRTQLNSGRGIAPRIAGALARAALKPYLNATERAFLLSTVGAQPNL